MPECGSLLREGNVTIAFGATSLVLDALDFVGKGFNYSEDISQFYKIDHTDWGAPYVNSPLFMAKNIFYFETILSRTDVERLQTMQTAAQAAYINGTDGRINLTDSYYETSLAFKIALVLPNDLFANLAGSIEGVEHFNLSFEAFEISATPHTLGRTVTVAGLLLDWRHFKGIGFWRNPKPSQQNEVSYTDYGAAFTKYPLFSAQEVFKLSLYLRENEVEFVRDTVRASQASYAQGSALPVPLVDNFYESAQSNDVILQIGDDFGSNFIGRDVITNQFLFECDITAESVAENSSSIFTKTVTLSITGPGGAISITFDWRHWTANGFSSSPINSQQAKSEFNPFGFSITKAFLFTPRLIFSFKVRLTEPERATILNMMLVSSQLFANKGDGRITLTDNYFGGGASFVVLDIPDGFGSGVVGQRGGSLLLDADFGATEIVL